MLARHGFYLQGDDWFQNGTLLCRAESGWLQLDHPRVWWRAEEMAEQEAAAVIHDVTSRGYRYTDTLSADWGVMLYYANDLGDIAEITVYPDADEVSCKYTKSERMVSAQDKRK